MCSIKDSQNFHAIFTSVYIILICYVFKCLYCKAWKTWWNIFVYFSCRWFFKIIFTFINLFYHRFKMCINTKWCFIIFLVLINSNILVFSEGNATLQKILCSHTFLYDPSLLFALKEWRQFKQWKSQPCFDNIPLNNPDNFLLQGKAILHRFESLTEDRRTCFLWFEFSFEI